MIKLVIIVFIVLIAITVPIVGVHMERVAYNGGVCRHCKTKLRHFDNDSQGGRGYVCDKCGYVTWVSYNCVDRKVTNNDKR